MYSYGLIQENTWLDNVYLEKEQKSFLKIQQEDITGGQHIAVFKNREMVGGITLEYIVDIQKDLKLNQYWNVLESKPAIRLKRLWALPGNNKTFLRIFHAVTEIVGGETLLLGVLALPLAFVEEIASTIGQSGIMVPKNTHVQHQWDPKLKASSEGQKLMKSYLMFGAKVLGPLCSCPEDHSVRICLGMYTKDIPKKRIESYV